MYKTLVLTFEVVTILALVALWFILHPADKV